MPMYPLAWTRAQTTSSGVFPTLSAPQTWLRTCTSAPPIAARSTTVSSSRVLPSRPVRVEKSPKHSSVRKRGTASAKPPGR